MNEPLFEKDNVLTALSEINHQLEELETTLGESFSDLRSQWYCAEKQRLSACEQKISSLENLTGIIDENKAFNWEYNHYSILNEPAALRKKLGFQC
jgi:hypothetical protein